MIKLPGRNRLLNDANYDEKKKINKNVVYETDETRNKRKKTKITRRQTVHPDKIHIRRGGKNVKNDSTTYLNSPTRK